jgi:hypothetical protein
MVAGTTCRYVDIGIGQCRFQDGGCRIITKLAEESHRRSPLLDAINGVVAQQLRSRNGLVASLPTRDVNLYRPARGYSQIFSLHWQTFHGKEGVDVATAHHEDGSASTLLLTATARTR